MNNGHFGSKVFFSYNLSHSLTAEKRRKFFIFPFVNMNNIGVFCNENSTNFRSNKIGRGGGGRKTLWIGRLHHKTRILRKRIIIIIIGPRKGEWNHHDREDFTCSELLTAVGSYAHAHEPNADDDDNNDSAVAGQSVSPGRRTWKKERKRKRNPLCKRTEGSSHLLKRESERERGARARRHERDGESRTVVVVRLFMIANLIS